MDKPVNLELTSLLDENARLTLRLRRAPVRDPGPDDVIVAMTAAPINPSDLGLMVAAADLSTLAASGQDDDRVLTATVPAGAMPHLAARIGQTFVVGNEGAGRVVGAGTSPAAQALLGKTVAVRSGATYARYVVTRAADCLALPDDIDAAAGASAFVNPMTALAMVETMRAEGHRALIHTAAASNLGRMLNRICLADGIPLVNVVRSAAQATILREAGAIHVCVSSDPLFADTLAEAVRATGAMLAFDAIGGGRIANTLLQAMEKVSSAGQPYSRYGSSTRKQVYIYGALDTGPTTLTRSYGFSWSVSGFLLTDFLSAAPRETIGRMRHRVVAEIGTTFASHYAQTISLAEALDPDVFAASARRATGEKYLIDPSRD